MTAGHVWPMRPRTVSVLCYIQLHEQLLDNSTPQHGVRFVRFVRFVCFVASCIQVWWFWWCSSLMKYCSAQILQQLQCTYYSHERMSTSLFSCNLRNDGKLLHVCTKLSGKKKETGCCVWYSPRLPGYTIPISFTGHMYCLYNIHRTWLGTRETWPYDQWIPLSSVFCGYVVLDKWHLYTCTQLPCPHQQVQV